MRRVAVWVAALGLTACAPWTVRPIGEPNGEAVADPAAYVDSIWKTKLAAAIEREAVEARAILDAAPDEAVRRYGRRAANGPAYFVVRGEGVVTEVDTRSRVGLAMVDVAPFDGRADVSVQIGPVLRGTSLRDATGVVRFTDFVNQLQFADVGNELNQRVLKGVLAGLNAASLKGRVVEFAGTVEAAPALRELAPVRFVVKERR